MTMTANELAELYRERIQSGLLHPGDKLPSLSALQAEHDVGPGAANQAIAKLRAAGLIESRHGSGNYVRAERPRAVLANCWADGLTASNPSGLTVVDVDVAELPASDLVESGLEGVKAGEKVVRRRSRVMLGDTPAHIEWVYYPADLAHGTAIVFRDAGEGGVYARLAEQGLTVDRSRRASRMRPMRRIWVSGQARRCSKCYGRRGRATGRWSSAGPC
jgi:GntR family transcriptional regulator